jgi:preprotein translocase subunit SecA
MFVSILSKIFGTNNNRFLNVIRPTIQAINDLSSEIKKLSDKDLKNRTSWFRGRLEKGESTEDILVEVFATVREASRRTLGEFHYDVQLMGGVVLHRGGIAEMKTGEGKTLVSTLAVYLNALKGDGVHVITVNDYLAKRDNEWMGKVYRFLGLTVGYIIHDMDDTKRRYSYNCDITYGTNNEFGFDYLRDNMKTSNFDIVQRKFNYALVDEVDNILIDEARTPLIISGPSDNISVLYKQIDSVIRNLNASDYDYDEKTSSITLTDSGNKNIEKLLLQDNLIDGKSLYDIENISIVYHVNQALRAHFAFQKEKDYIVKDDKIVIIDEFTGRMMDGRRYSDALHQSLEAKENVTIREENQTLASITFQNYFRLYPKLSGMTGTASTESIELSEIYNLDTVIIPTNRILKRIDYNDEVYCTKDEKYNSIINLIKKSQRKQQPILVGTTSIEKSDYISYLLKSNSISHRVLNARYHEKEAQIITQAGMIGSITIATNMAGRGTDIQLGGNISYLVSHEIKKLNVSHKKVLNKVSILQKIIKRLFHNRLKVLESGGLYVVGTERHESRRIDNQLRGRSGRQGDPGSSKFFISLDDDLMRIFAAKDRLNNLLKNIGLRTGEAIVHSMVNKSIEKAQKKVEDRNFDIRKQLLKYDDVINNQRKVIYDQRRVILNNNVHDIILFMIEDVIDSLVPKNLDDINYKESNFKLLDSNFFDLSSLKLSFLDWLDNKDIELSKIKDRLFDIINVHICSKIKKVGLNIWGSIEKSILLMQLDICWKDHLKTIDNLRQCIHLRAYGQRDPLSEFKSESFSLFNSMIKSLNTSTIKYLSFVNFNISFDEIMKSKKNILENGSYRLEKINNDKQTPSKSVRDKLQHSKKLSRNDNCPCGSGKRYKHCHGR